LIVLIAVTIGALVSGLALAFGLGAKPLTTNLIGTHYLRFQYSIGQTVLVGDIEGQILEFTPTGIKLDTEEGVSSIPGASYFYDVIILRTEDNDDT